MTGARRLIMALPTPLEVHAPFLVAANVRGSLPTDACVVSGRARFGDLVIGELEGSVAGPAEVRDRRGRLHRVTAAQRIVAVVGPRDSSTSVYAVVPDEGLEVAPGVLVDWVAGESGTVGRVRRPPAPDAPSDAEGARPFRAIGRITDPDGRPVNLDDLAVRPRAERLACPVVMVAASAAGSGKTVLSGEIIRRLVARGHRVGAVKTTGTGGVLDSRHHAAAGAAVTLDQVDAGMISTACPKQMFRERIPRVFRAMQDQATDIVVAELGGDLASVNNPTVFEIEEIAGKVVLLAVIAGDPMAALGNAVALERYGVEVERLRHFSSPFRNPLGMARRLAFLGIDRTWDPRSPDDLDRFVDEVDVQVRIARRRSG